MCLLPCCYSCHVKVILDRMVPSCLQQDPRQRAAAAAGAEERQLTLEEMLYPPASWEAEAAATPLSRRSSPKVCPVTNLSDFFSDEEGEEEADSPGSGGGGGYSPPGGVNADSVSMSVSVVSRASLRSVSRRVSFRSPDESDVFIIPARSHYPSDDDDDDDDDGCSSDGEPSRT